MNFDECQTRCGRSHGWIFHSTSTNPGGVVKFYAVWCRMTGQPVLKMTSVCEFCVPVCGNLSCCKTVLIYPVPAEQYGKIGLEQAKTGKSNFVEPCRCDIKDLLSTGHLAGCMKG